MNNGDELASNSYKSKGRSRSFSDIDQESRLRMKNPNRHVVVEYKNRRSRKATNALWGTMDLKSIASDIESELPPSSDAPAQLDVLTDTASHAVARAPEPELQADTEEVTASGQNVLPGSQNDFPGDQGHTGPDAPERPDEAISPSETTSRKPLTKKRRNRDRAETTIQSDILRELATLEKENAELKQELIISLRAENDQLKLMLLRLAKRRSGR
ncbi:hypothetical protein [Brucella cytisi]|nr:hypothetical protein [Brucella cytisi]